MLPTKETIKNNIKSWLIINAILLVPYFVYDYIRYSVTGEVDPNAILLGQIVGNVIGIFLFYLLIPHFILKIFRRNKAPLAQIVVMPKIERHTYIGGAAAEQYPIIVSADERLMLGRR